MSDNVKTKPKTSKKTSVSKTQKFIRINIDDKLDSILNRYIKEYPLFNRSDIVKLLLSKAIKQDSDKSLLDIMKGATFIDIDDENAQFAFLRKHNLSK
jgi:metal-responsive CopG/Arc/MetJ family transcriptional regulator